MLQFYKMQFEHAQAKIAQLERETKKQKRELQHEQSVIHNLIQERVDLMADLHMERDENLRQTDYIAAQHLVMMHKENQFIKVRNVKDALVGHISRFAAGHPENEQLQTLEEIATIEEANYDSDETEPDLDMEL